MDGHIRLIRHGVYIGDKYVPILRLYDILLHALVEFFCYKFKFLKINLEISFKIRNFAPSMIDTRFPSFPSNIMTSIC